MNQFKRKSIPENEYRARIQRLKENLDANNLDAVLLFGNEHDQGDIRYFSNYRPMLERSSLFIPLEGKPILLSGPECFLLAKDTSIIEDVRICEDLQIPGEEYPNVEMKTLDGIVSEVLGSKKYNPRIGLVHMDYVPHFLANSVKRTMKNIETIDFSKNVENMRAIKSEAEIDIIRRNYRLASHGLISGLNYTREGLLETDIAAEAASYMWRRGPEQMSHIMMISSGEKTRAPLSFPTDKVRINEGDLVIIGLGVVYEGYYSDHSMTTYVGNVNREVKEVMKVCWEAKERAVHKVEPGIRGKDVDRAARSLVKEAGYGDNCAYGVGHGVGLQHAEPPMLGPRSKVKLRPGMVFAIDVGLWDLPFGGLRFEEGVLVTEKGHERLTKIDPSHVLDFQVN